MAIKLDDRLLTPDSIIFTPGADVIQLLSVTKSGQRPIL